LIAVDTSAVVAILWQERDWERLRIRLAAEDSSIMSTGNVLELQLVLMGAGAGKQWDSVEALFTAYRIAIRPFDDVQLRFAREAALRFGKGRHRARLNFGDCFAYALARCEGIRLLCTGGDFPLTDVELA
jgi:ribonuclease VapC